MVPETDQIYQKFVAALGAHFNAPLNHNIGLVSKVEAYVDNETHQFNLSLLVEEKKTNKIYIVVSQFVHADLWYGDPMFQSLYTTAADTMWRLAVENLINGTFIGQLAPQKFMRNCLLTIKGSNVYMEAIDRKMSLKCWPLFEGEDVSGYVTEHIAEIVYAFLHASDAEVSVHPGAEFWRMMFSVPAYEGGTIMVASKDIVHPVAEAVRLLTIVGKQVEKKLTGSPYQVAEWSGIATKLAENILTVMPEKIEVFYGARKWAANFIANVQKMKYEQEHKAALQMEKMAKFAMLYGGEPKHKWKLPEMYEKEELKFEPIKSWGVGDHVALDLAAMEAKIFQQFGNLGSDFDYPVEGGEMAQTVKQLRKAAKENKHVAIWMELQLADGHKFGMFVQVLKQHLRDGLKAAPDDARVSFHVGDGDGFLYVTPHQV